LVTIAQSEPDPQNNPTQSYVFVQELATGDTTILSALPFAPPLVNKPLAVAADDKNAYWLEVQYEANGGLSNQKSFLREAPLAGGPALELAEVDGFDDAPI